MVCPFNSFALFRLGKILAKFKELVGGYKTIPASRDKKFGLRAAFEEVKIEHREWRRDCCQRRNSIVLKANGKSKASASRITSKPDSLGIDFLYRGYKGNGCCPHLPAHLFPD